MASRNNKRKTRPYDDPHPPPKQPDSSLFIHAYEADLIRGPQAWDAARSLEVFSEGSGRAVVGDGLIQWSGQQGLGFDDMGDEEHIRLGSGSVPTPKAAQDGGSGVWMDRYDARLLLESLPEPPLPSVSSSVPEPSSPGGWSDLPSDAEDTFFLNTDEIEDYRRDKRRRLIDNDREARLKALRDEDPDDGDADPRRDWGGSDEEPDEPQREFMRRTATHVLSSPNPAQLEMRILANHGADPRFAFLRGRWARAWRLAKSKIKLELQEAERKRAEKDNDHKGGGMGGLAGYGSDSGEDESEGGQDASANVEAQKEAAVDCEDPPPPEPSLEDDAVKAARRARAKEWADKRRAAMKSVQSQESHE